MKEKRKTAPVKRGVVLAALAMMLGTAALVGMLLFVNATTLRGTVSRSALTTAMPEELDASAEIWDVYLKRGVFKTRGALYRKGIGAVDLRVGLIWQPEGGEEEDTVTLLNTQMVQIDRREAQTRGVDDHCGFAAAVKLERLPHPGEDGQYRAVLIDEGKLIDALSLTIRRQGKNWTVERGSR